MPFHRAVRILCLAASLALVAAGPGPAGEWASWRGPEQNGVASDRGLISQWSRQGENLIWRVDFTGRSTPVVFDGRVCTNGRAGEGITRQEVVACWDADDGDLLWERRFTVYNTDVPWNRVGWGNVVADPETGYLYVHPVDGRLVCLDRNGKTVWEWRLGEDLGRMSGYGGRTHTPIVDEDRLILSVIGPLWGEYRIPRHRYFAFDKLSGEVLWISTPGGSLADANTQSTPVVAVIDGQRLLVGGNADGWIYALQARTGKKVWGFHLSKRGLNASVVVGGNTVYAAHSEENVDPGTMGRVVAIDATGQGDVTATHERWRAEGIQAGFSSPLLHDGRLYVVDNSANLHALDAKTGKSAWVHNLGTVGKASPVWADGKIYTTEVNGNFLIVEPGTDGARTLDREHLEIAAENRYAEIYGSPAVAYDRVFFATEEGLYCLGDKNRPLPPPLVTPWPPNGPPPAGTAPAQLAVVPAEVVTRNDEALQFKVLAFDARGNFLREINASWSLDGLRGEVTAQGRVTLDPEAGSQVGKVVATAGELTAAARVRAAAPLPWTEDFTSVPVGTFPATWLGGSKGATVEEVEGEKILVQPRAKRMAPRATIYLGPSYLAGYTIEADVRATQEGRRRADLGLINSGYTLDLQGNHQRIEVRSWASEKRMAQQFPFAWEMNVWYRMKLRVDAGDEKAVIRGKVWRRDADEPAEWTVTVEDPLPIPNGSPGLYGFTPVEGHFDNVKVTGEPMILRGKSILPTLLVVLAAGSAATAGEPEQAMFGNGWSRNMVSAETGLPATWDPKTGHNVKWVQPVGSQSYAGPVVFGGKVFVGTNNEGRRNPKLDHDRGVVMAFRAADGEFLWQTTHTKLPEGKLHDWPLQGVCSTPVVEGDRLYYVSNRAEVVSVDTEGFRDGENDGPVTDEENTGEIDGDVVWSLDMIAELDVFPHNLAAGSPLIVGDLLYTTTGTGVDEGHVNVPSPFAPSFIAVNKTTGKLVWEDATPGEATLHGTWTNPAYGVIAGRPQVIVPGGDGWLYSFAPQTGEHLWRFNCNPEDSVWRLGGAGTKNNVIATPVIYDDKVYVAVGQDPEHGEGNGHLWAIDATGSGDVTGQAVVWHRGGEDFHRTISTVAIKDDVVYAADLSGFLYALDAQTGEHFWTYDAFAAIWGSPFVADGKIYLGDEDGDVAVLREGKKLEVLAEINMGAAVYTTPVAHDGVLYVLSRNRLFALAEGAETRTEKTSG